jgi:DNA-directed RNA polymerase subunit F
MKNSLKDKIDGETWERLCWKIQNEGGLSECLEHYSDFPEIKDKKFRELVEDLLKISKELKEYIGISSFEE